MSWYWVPGGIAAGLALGWAVASHVLRRHPVLLWPGDWLTAWRLRRERRKMSEPGDRMTP